MRTALLPQQRAALPRSSSSRRLVAAPRCSSSAAAAAAPGRPLLPSGALLRLTAAAAGVVRSGVAAMRAAAAEASRQVAEQDVNAQIRDSVKQMKVLALVAPFAAVSGGADTFMIITRAVASFIKLYLLLLFVRVLLSWFPTFAWWENQPFAALRQVRHWGRWGLWGARTRHVPQQLRGGLGCACVCWAVGGVAWSCLSSGHGVGCQVCEARCQTAGAGRQVGTGRQYAGGPCGA